MHLSDNASLNNVRIEKSTLIELLQKNKDSHVGTFNESTEEYIKRVQEWHDKQYKRGLNGKEMEVNFSITKPFSHIEDYDKVLTMLRLSVDTVFALSEREFENYVMDKWSWSNGFTTACSGVYLGS